VLAGYCFLRKNNSQVGFLKDYFEITQVINVNIKRLGVRQVIKQPVNMLIIHQVYNQHVNGFSKS
jgi:hypothetical protein